MELVDLFREDKNRISRHLGDFVFKEGEDAGEMYLVIEGDVEILVGNVRVEIAKPGSVIGEMALIERRPRAATARAMTECALLPVDAERFEHLVHQVPSFATHVMKTMAERLRRMNNLAVDGV